MRSSKYLVSSSGVGAGDLARLCGAEGYIFDLTFFIPILIEYRHCSRRYFHVAGNALPNLPAQHGPSLVFDETAFGEASLSDDLFEACTIELSVGAAE